MNTAFHPAARHLATAPSVGRNGGMLGGVVGAGDNFIIRSAMTSKQDQLPGCCSKGKGVFS